MKMSFIFNFNMSERCETGPTGRNVIARGDACTIEQCGCGVLHVTIGVVTMRLHPSAVASMYETIGEALASTAKPQMAELYS